ncbi:DUF3151 domain-containing protein [Sanguibacter inulinus]|jgi:hypothetical protein|uniref:DUF3151 domain-containing protein n=3 Tax=Sanguibacteraceae TaxID=145360 RepID=A0A853EUK5_9MICO|nr:MULTISPECIES: DUF3151 domain-containing protein [Sanguibacter]MBF0723094.1 DUF3151 domain-containing protein [Sanguibacter inulinus]NYS94239.1 DUF3151 domain-containing protein [Sanguibacter inulinus]WPF82094.1 DUF3151 domain-containing protein [Sanguibacter sp. 4.1]
MGPMSHAPLDPSSNLLGPAPTLLGADHPDVAARAEIDGGRSAQDVARDVPSSSYAWALLAEAALDRGDDVTAYAFARTGYHRGLDSLRRAGWRGQGPIPVTHAPNQGFLRALLALAEAAAAIGEDDEAARCQTFLVDSGVSADAVAALR